MKSLIMVLLLICLMITPVYAGSIALLDKVMVTEKVVAVTLEDVENAPELEKVLILCKGKNIRVSLFSPSYFVDSQQTLVKQAVAEGHEFGNCGVKQVDWGELREEDIVKEYRAAEAVLYKVLKIRPSIVKPAYSQYEDKFFNAAAAFNSGSIAIRGTIVDGKMIEEQDAFFIGSGNIITMSMQDKDAVASLSELFSKLKNKGYQIVTVSELLHKGSRVL